MEQETIFSVNKRNIDRRIDSGLKLMRENYTLKEIDTREFRYLHIQQMDYTVNQYEIEGVGNLTVMECKDSLALQMDSFVFTPYYKNLPLFSSDYMYIKERRSFLNEVYSIVAKEDELYRRYVEEFAKNKSAHDHLPDMPMKECWYDSMRPVCTAKMTAPENDDEIIGIFEENIKTLIKMEKETPLLNEEEYKLKWQRTQAYTDGLVDNGGVSTDVFKAVLGADKTKEFFNTIFFAPALYKR